MIESIIRFSIHHKLIVLMFVAVWVAWGVYSLTKIPIGAVPDITNNQVQILTTSRNLSTLDIEQFITYPVELEFANLPGVQEIRSISKFGLSVVTVVFDEAMGTYLPRQLISEKLKSATENIPAGFGAPQMGPITTGLGEIYQYILDVEPGYEDRYSTMDLRTIQDWIVKRQLSGIPGVVEVNTWGGYLKQYEVALNPQRLKSMNVRMPEVFKALEENNDVTGGGYIEKDHESYFIRGEGLVKSLQDIKQIVVKVNEGIPVYVRDIAEVRIGSATRFGAITGNGQGEKVMGQVMMLKDENSNQVIRRVNQRVAEIQGSLPEGVIINPFLERTELINKTTFTVVENLTLGALIVIFVLVLMLGNFRSGLIVASIIPLSLLFGISMMNLFGISANLMSLGAIDFGIIIDGAVIIIEYIFFKITQNRHQLLGLTGNALKEAKDRLTLASATEMMQPAIFGQIIILIVFIPILSLTGIEGKMFKPMALSFGFALLGAMILSLTYVPVMAAIVCRATPEKRANLSQRIMSFLENLYNPIITRALAHQKLVMISAGVLLIAGFGIFTRLGGEFIPTLDEGDFVVQPIIKTGTSLSKTIEIVTELESILLREFPEVAQVVTRIGAAEVPTDPMSMEQTDVIIKLKPKHQWVTAKSKEALADKMKTAMSAVPGLDFEFTQPIEMRFNELITGVRSDVAIKIYGEDLDLLQSLARQVQQLITAVPGAADINVEKVAGLPQMSIRYERDKIAQYGMNIKELNQMVRMAFAGEVAGTVMEGERRFDLVVRFHDAFRKDITNLQNLYVDLPNGRQVPLTEVATIDYQTGPAQISRDDTKRRVVIGVNVRNRDVESIVEDIQVLIQDNIQLPAGYSVTYGGQFENLQNAKQRLLLVVPIALILILILLYFTFGSISQALLIYTAIPFAAIGGILLLWLRGMPFSISAGIGFIALFGIAVLNGIVLIEYFNELEKKGWTDIQQRVIEGTKVRLRPVLLTASAAALGFFPMAFSTSAGAEVQRPLATVVIGGLITATILTLVVLPVLYTRYNRTLVTLPPAALPPTAPVSAETPAKSDQKGLGNPGALVLWALLSFGSLTPALGQKQVIDLNQAISVATEQNLALQSAQLRVQQQERLEKTAFEIDRTHVYYGYDENNIAENGTALRVYGLQQSFSLPNVYSRNKSLLQHQTELRRSEFEILQIDLIKEVSKSYYQIQYYQQRLQQLTYLDSLYQGFAAASNRRFELGETDYLEKLTAEARYQEIHNQMNQTAAQVTASYQQLAGLLQWDQEFELLYEAPARLTWLENDTLNGQAGLAYYQQLREVALAQTRVEKSKQWLQVSAQYFLGRSQSPGAQNFNGYQFGLGIPLFSGAQRGRIQAARIASEIREKEIQNYQVQWDTKRNELLALLDQHGEALNYYEGQGLNMASEIVQIAHRSYLSGETGYLQYIESLESARQINLSYLQHLHNYNQTVLEITYLVNP